MTQWVILRCAPSKTLRLAESLAEDGIAAWTPSEMRRNRRPRAKAQESEPVPIMPTYVFADADRVVDLIELSELPFKPRRGVGCREAAHEEFSVFHHFDRIPVVKEGALAALRQEERDANDRYQRSVRRTLAKARGEPLEAGEPVRIPEGPFAGMSGYVEESNGRFTLICFGRTRVKISTFILRSDMADGFQAATDLEAA